MAGGRAADTLCSEFCQETPPVLNQKKETSGYQLSKGGLPVVSEFISSERNRS